MKIIHRGMIPSERLYRGRCINVCESIIEATHDELTHTSHQRDGEFHKGECPVCACGNIIYFEEYK